MNVKKAVSGGGPVDTWRVQKQFNQQNTGAAYCIHTAETKHANEGFHPRRDRSSGVLVWDMVAAGDPNSILS